MTKTHCMSTSPEWQAWSGMRNRCRNPKGTGAQYYVERGIRVCERWESFENFFADMGARPSPGHSVDRINNDGDYEPDNCRWATRREQNLNNRRNRLVTAFGVTAPLGHFVKECTAYKRARKRIFQWGWEPEKALTVPPVSGRAGWR